MATFPTALRLAVVKEFDPMLSAFLGLGLTFSLVATASSIEAKGRYGTADFILGMVATFIYLILIVILLAIRP